MTHRHMKTSHPKEEEIYPGVMQQSIMSLVNHTQHTDDDDDDDQETRGEEIITKNVNDVLCGWLQSTT